jgi:inner membrane protein
MTGMLITLGPWSWIVLGAILLGLELAVPGVFLMWLGLAAVLVGLISFVVDWGWQAQGIAFALFALASVLLWRRVARTSGAPSDSPFLNRRTQGMVGRVFTLEKPIANGVGVVRVDDTTWRVNGPDRPAGSRVRVVEADGAILTVEAAD